MTIMYASSFFAWLVLVREKTYCILPSRELICPLIQNHNNLHSRGSFRNSINRHECLTASVGIGANQID